MTMANANIKRADKLKEEAQALGEQADLYGGRSDERHRTEVECFI